MKKVAFITGITGMVGSHLADFLIENTDWEVVGLIRWRSPLDNIKNLIENINNKNRVKLVYGDLNDGISIDTAIKEHKPDYVFHLAAQSFPKTSFDSPIETLNVNIQGTVRIGSREIGGMGRAGV
jgi:GDPmannose 4,6-dehydratase